jgi:hypothetical protein
MGVTALIFRKAGYERAMALGRLMLAATDGILPERRGSTSRYRNFRFS